ncbi:MAG: IS3 family transposase, partial [Thermoanaerobacteraceae bacterium]|nr:IS3 family transposase [Thermoanaerobacteraceae bacterium]
DECLGRYEFQSYGEAYKAVSEFIRRYNQKRIHSSIRYMTPNDFYRNHILHGITTREITV